MSASGRYCCKSRRDTAFQQKCARFKSGRADPRIEAAPWRRCPIVKHVNYGHALTVISFFLTGTGADYGMRAVLQGVDQRVAEIEHPAGVRKRSRLHGSAGRAAHCHRAARGRHRHWHLLQVTRGTLQRRLASDLPDGALDAVLRALGASQPRKRGFEGREHRIRPSDLADRPRSQAARSAIRPPIRRACPARVCPPALRTFSSGRPAHRPAAE